MISASLNPSTWKEEGRPRPVARSLAWIPKTCQIQGNSYQSVCLRRCSLKVICPTHIICRLSPSLASHLTPNVNPCPKYSSPLLQYVRKSSWLDRWHSRYVALDGTLRRPQDWQQDTRATEASHERLAHYSWVDFRDRISSPRNLR